MLRDIKRDVYFVKWAVKYHSFRVKHFNTPRWQDVYTFH